MTSVYKISPIWEYREEEVEEVFGCFFEVATSSHLTPNIPRDRTRESEFERRVSLCEIKGKQLKKNPVTTTRAH